MSRTRYHSIALSIEPNNPVSLYGYGVVAKGHCLSLKIVETFAIVLTLLILAASFGFVRPALAEAEESIVYEAHVQNVGWMPAVVDGQEAGTTGRALQLEALRVSLRGECEGSVRCQAHVANEGTHAWVSDGEVVGTTGRSHAIESLRIELEGEVSQRFDVEYRAHVAGIGWQDWVSNGQVAGTEGQARPMEAVQIRLVVKEGIPDMDEPEGTIDDVEASEGETIGSGTDATDGNSDGSHAEERIAEEPSQDDGVQEGAAMAEDPRVLVSAHSQNVGWADYVEDGVTAGTTGRSLRLEALRMRLEGIEEGSIQYQVHVQNEGWHDYASDDSIAGTVGKSRAIEAVRIKLSDNLAEHYDVVYRVHASKLGWLAWTKNDSTAGSVGCGIPLEAIEVRVVPAGSFETGGIAEAKAPTLRMSAHCQDLGWLSEVSNWDVAGTTGQSRRLEAVSLALEGHDGIRGGIAMRSHVSNIGWMDWVEDGISGTVGHSLAVEAVQIRLTGTLASVFDVYYRVHSANYGWLGWAANGEQAGTTGGGLQAEALQVCIVIKGTPFDRGGAAFVDASGSRGVHVAHHMQSPLCQQSYANADIRRYGCCAVSYSIALSVVTGHDHNPANYHYGPKGGYTHYTDGHIAYNGPYSARRVYDGLRAGHASMLHYYYANGGEHWVCAVGIRDGANPDALGYGDILVIDPYTGCEVPLSSACLFHAPNGVARMMVIA